MPRPYRLTGHCGAFRLEVDAELTGLMECNCSSCVRAGFIHWKVPVEAVRVLTERSGVSATIWHDIDGGHRFCPTCGTGLFRTGYRTRVSVNARCIEGIDIFDLEVRREDGRREMPPGPTM